MTSRFEYLLSLIGLQSSSKAPTEVASTAPARMTRHDALTEISYAMQGPHRLRVIAALLRWSPDLLTPRQVEELRVAVRDAVLAYALTQTPRMRDGKIPMAVVKATGCAMAEHSDWHVCRTCHGRGDVLEVVEGEGLVPKQCPECKGLGWKPWTTAHRARYMDMPWTTANRQRIAMVSFAVALLHGWASEGVTAIQQMGLAKR